MKNFTNLVEFSDSKLGYRLFSKRKSRIYWWQNYFQGKDFTNSDQFIGGAQHPFWLRTKISEQMKKSREQR